MKVTTDDYQRMLVACRNAQAQHPQHTPQTYAEHGIGKDSGMRFRWDLLHISGFDVCSLYHYCNDTHVDTALRSVIAELY